MKETYGVPVEEIQEAIKHGVRKINIDTDIRLAMTARDPQVPGREPRQVRSARLPQAGARGGQEDLPRALPRSSAAKARRRRSRRSRCRRSPSATRRASSRRRWSDAAARCPRRRATPTRRSREPAALAAAARARQGARQLRGRRRPPADGRERPPERVRRRHGRADPRQGRAAHAAWRCSGSRGSATSCPTTSPATIPRAWSPPTSARRCAAARCWSSG